MALSISSSPVSPMFFERNAIQADVINTSFGGSDNNNSKSIRGL